MKMKLEKKKKKSILELREGHTAAAKQATWYKGGTDGGKG